MSAAEDFLNSLSGDAPAPKPEQLPDDIPDIDSDTKAKHERAKAYYPIIDRYARRFGPDLPDLSSLAKAVVLRESGGNPDAGSDKGARGLMQLIPGTYSDMGGDPSMASDPEDNIHRGVKYLAEQLRKYGDENKALAAYNAGPGAVDKYGGIPPFHETENYVKAVQAYKKRLPKAGASENFLANLGDDGAMPASASPEDKSGSAAENFLASLGGEPAAEAGAQVTAPPTPQNVPSLEGFQSQGNLLANEQPAPLTRGGPQFQKAQNISGVEPIPPNEAPIPFTGRQMPILSKYQPKGLPTAQEQHQIAEANLQAAGAREPIGSEEIGMGLMKGVAQGALPGIANPKITKREEQGAELGRPIGALAPMALGPLGPEAVAAGMTAQSFLQNAKPDEETGIKNPIETVVQTTLAQALGSLNSSGIHNIIARMSAGAGIGGVQAAITQSVTDLANKGKLDLTDDEAVKNIVTGMIMNSAFGVHGEGVSAKEIQHPSEPQLSPQFQEDWAKQFEGSGTEFHPINSEPNPNDMPSVEPTPPGPHHITRGEYYDQLSQMAPGASRSSFTPHEQLVEDALNHGLEVPERVLKDYPHLQDLKTFLQGQDLEAGTVTPEAFNAFERYVERSKKNSSSSSLTPFLDTSNKEGTGAPVPAVESEADPSGLTRTPTGTPSTFQNEDPASRNTQPGISPIPENVPQGKPEVKGISKQEPDEEVPSLYNHVIKIARKTPIYLDAEAKNQLGLTSVKYKDLQKQYGQIFTADKSKGISLDGLAERIRESGNNGTFIRGFDARDVQMNDIIDALAGGGVDEARTSGKEENSAFDDFLRNGSDDVLNTRPIEARALPKEFDAADTHMTRVVTKGKEKEIIRYQDPQGNTYDFKPDEIIHTGGEFKKTPEAPGKPMPVSQEEDNSPLAFNVEPNRISSEMQGMQERQADPAEIPRVQLARKISGIIDDVYSGKKSAKDGFKEIARHARKSQRGKYERETIKLSKPRERGHEWLEERLLRARRLGELEPEAADLGIWFVRQNPHLVSDLGISVRSGGGDGTAGYYDSSRRIATLIKGSRNSDTVVHEMLHHVERMMPEDSRNGILQAWGEGLGRELEKADAEPRVENKPSRIEDIANIIKAAAGDQDAAEKVREGFTSGQIPYEFYQYTNPSEYWAVNGARILGSRQRAEGWAGQAKQWLKEFSSGIKSIFGLKNDSAILKGLRSVINGEGEFVNRRMLQQDAAGYFSPEKIKSSQEDIFGNKGRTASQGLIKGKVPDKGLEGTPLFGSSEETAKAKAEEDQQRLFSLEKPEEKKPKVMQHHVGPEAQKPYESAQKGLGKAISYEAGKGEQKSGFITNAEKIYTDGFNEAYPIERVQSLVEKESGQKLKPEESIKFAINRVLGSGGSADLHIERNLKPMFQGGKAFGFEFQKLTPEQSRKVDAFALARDALWRYDNAKGYDNPALSREEALRVLREHAALSPEDKKAIEKAANGLTLYANDMAARKVKAGLWTQEEFDRFTQNPYYIPEIRDFDKVTNRPVGKFAKKLFTSTNKLIRGTLAVDLAAPVFDPISALVHDTRQFAAESAKMNVWQKVIDLAEKFSLLKGWIKRMPKEYEPAPHEGEVKVLRTRETILDPSTEKFAEQYENALFTVKRQENADREEAMAQRTNNRIQRNMERESAPVQQKMNDILGAADRSRVAWKQVELERAEATIKKFKKMKPEDRLKIEDWIDEGKPLSYLVPKEIADAVNGMSPVEWSFYQKPFVQAASLFRKMQVGWNPSFTISNIARDMQEAYHNVKLPPYYAFKGFLHYLKKDDVYESFMRHGGSMEGDESGMRQSTGLSQEIRYGDRFWRDRYAKAKDAAAWEEKKITLNGKEISYGKLARMAEVVKKTALIPFEMAEVIGEAGEMATRLGVMDYAMNGKKLSPREATELARQGTLDFKRIGSKMKSLNSLVPFLNARIQGIDRTVRTFKDDPVGATMRAFIVAGAPTAALLAWNVNNPNYADIPAWEKEYYWILMENWTGKGYLKVAKGSLAKMLTNPLQMMWENYIGTAKKDGWKIGVDVLKAGLPIDDISSTLNPLAKIAIEQSAGAGGYDFYFDRDIVKDPARPAAYQYDPKTAETLKTIGRGLNLSPERLQHIASSLTGGTATNILYLTDALLGHTGKLETAPVISKFLGETEDWKSDFAQQQRTLMKQIKDKKASMMSKGEYVSGSMRGIPVDMKVNEERIKATAQEIAGLAKKLEEVNKGIKAVDDLMQAIKDKNPSLKRHLLRPPTLSGAK